MTITQQLDDLCQRHTEIPVVIAAGEQLPVGSSGCFESLRLSRHTEEHLGSDGLKGVATSHPVGDLHQTIQGFRQCVRYPVLEVVEDFGTPVIDGSNQFAEGNGGDRIKASLTGPCQYQGYEFGANYLDSVCIDGMLWNADSGYGTDDGWMYTSGGDLPCPLCNFKSVVSRIAEEMREGFWVKHERPTRNPKWHFNEARRKLRRSLIRRGYGAETNQENS